MNRRVEILISIVLILAIIFLFGELFGYYPPPNGYVEVETREKVDNYPFGENIFFVETVVRYPVNVTVVNVTNQTFKVGIVGDTDKLSFGRLPIGFSERKTIEVNNPTNRRIEVKLRAYGNISEFMFYPENIFIEPKTYKPITVGINATKLGFYRGELDVIVRYPKTDVIERLMRWL